MQVWNQLFRSTATQKKYLSLCLSLSSLSIQNDGKVCNNHGSFRLLHCYTCRNCSSVTIPLMLFGSNPYCSASRFFTALNASKKKLRESFWNTHQWQNQVEWDHPCYLLPPFFRGTKTKTKSLRSNSPLVNWLRLGRVSVFQDRGAGAAKFWVEEWTNNPRESIYSPSHLWRSRPAVKDEFPSDSEVKKCSIMRFAKAVLLVCYFVCVFWSFNVSWSPKVTSLEDSSQYSPPFSYNSEASLQGLSNRPSRWRT